MVDGTGTNMKVSKTMPDWAVELTEQVCKDYKRATPPKIQWYNRTHEYSVGTTWKNRIHISAGSHGYDQELVLLHELAHWVANKNKPRQGHTIKFWRTAFELYDRYGIELGYAIWREEHYRKQASQAYTEQLAKKK